MTMKFHVSNFLESLRGTPQRERSINAAAHRCHNNRIKQRIYKFSQVFRLA